MAGGDKCRVTGPGAEWLFALDGRSQGVDSRRSGNHSEGVKRIRLHSLGGIGGESLQSWNGFLLAAELYGLGTDHDVQLPQRIAEVTHDDVARVARRLLDPARAVVVVAGPWNAPTA